MKRFFLLGPLVVAVAILAGCTSSNIPAVSEVNAQGDYYAIVNKQTSFLIFANQKAGVMKCHKGGSCKEITIVEK